MRMYDILFVWIRTCSDLLTLEHWETYGCIVSTVATNALVLKHQAISIHKADQTFFVMYYIGPVSYQNIALMVNKIRK